MGATVSLLLAVSDQQKKVKPAGCVDAPELGEGVRLHVRRLSVGDRLLMEEINSDKGKGALAKMIDLLPLCVVEEDGSPAFSDPPTADEVRAIRAIPGDVADRVLLRAVELSGNDKAAIDAKKNGSPPTPS